MHVHLHFFTPQISVPNMNMQWTCTMQNIETVATLHGAPMSNSARVCWILYSAVFPNIHAVNLYAINYKSSRYLKYPTKIPYQNTLISSAAETQWPAKFDILQIIGRLCWLECGRTYPNSARIQSAMICTIGLMSHGTHLEVMRCCRRTNYVICL